MTTTSGSGIYLCASTLNGQGSVPPAAVAIADSENQRSVSTFVTSSREPTASLPRGLYTNGMVPQQVDGPAQLGALNKTFSLPREGLCMTKSLLDEHTADESANRLCQEIDHLLFDNMI